MMAETSRAVYERGQLRPLEPLALRDGQEVRLAILSERAQARSALADVLSPVAAGPTTEADEVDETAILAAIDVESCGAPSMSDAIVDERREGP